MKKIVMSNLAIDRLNAFHLIEWLKANKKEVAPSTWEYDAEDIPKMQKYLKDKADELEHLRGMLFFTYSIVGDIDAWNVKKGKKVVKLTFTWEGL